MTITIQNAATYLEPVGYTKPFPLFNVTEDELAMLYRVKQKLLAGDTPTNICAHLCHDCIHGKELYPKMSKALIPYMFLSTYMEIYSRRCGRCRCRIDWIDELTKHYVRTKYKLEFPDDNAFPMFELESDKERQALVDAYDSIRLRDNTYFLCLTPHIYSNVKFRKKISAALDTFNSFPNLVRVLYITMSSCEAANLPSAYKALLRERWIELLLAQ